MAWENITVTQILDTRNKHKLKCSHQNCNRYFHVGERVTRQQRRAANRYFCPECAEKLRI
ncbi:hypothetical protein ACFLRN_02875 [Thermoproteota archaeon]